MLRQAVSIIALVMLSAGFAPVDDIPKGARWELTALGVTTEDRLTDLRNLADRRPVILAIVGTGGISRRQLSSRLDGQARLRCCQCPNYPDCDPRKNTHDTGQARVILDLTRALGIRVKLLYYQPADSYTAIAKAFAEAGRHADIVITFQSYWGDVGSIIDSIAQAQNALIISPYVEHSGQPTSTCPQGHAAKPWGEGIPHFITTVPLARKGAGHLTSSSNRGPQDSEMVNFIVPSYYASGPGGTCPSAAVAAAVAAWVYSVSARRPRPTEVVRLLRETVALDAGVLTSLPEFGEEEIDRLEAEIAAKLKTRKLDAVGVVNLYRIYQHVAVGAE